MSFDMSFFMEEQHLAIFCSESPKVILISTEVFSLNPP
jgi:hypothetical protein